MKLLRFLKAFIGGFGKEWQPKKNVVYKSWVKLPWYRHNERSFIVKILINNEELSGTFSVGNQWCEIRADNYKLILPKENVIFSKHLEFFNTIPEEGQNGGAGKVTIYTAKVLHFTSKDMKDLNNLKLKIGSDDLKMGFFRWLFHGKGYYVDKRGYPRWNYSDKLCHRTMAAKKYGRLSHRQVVHHIDGNKMNFNPDNLQIMTKRQHKKLHKKQKTWW